MAAALTRLPLIGKVYGVCCALLIAMLIAARFTPLYALSFISVSRESALYYRDMQRLQTVSVPLPAHVTQLAVSPDGTWIAYTDIRAGRYTLILNNLIHETQQVFPIEDGSITYLTWSPDSRSLAYQRDVLGTTGLFIYDLTRNQARQITDLWRCRSLAWSPDGGSLACNGFSARQFDVTDQMLIFDTRTDSEPRALSVTPSAVSAVTWSPDGTQLLFAQARFRRSPQLIRYDLPGDTWLPLSDEDIVLDSPSPSFSPDGRWIVYTSREAGSSIPIMRLMTRSGEIVRDLDFLPVTQSYMRVEWSPDSRLIAARAWLMQGDIITGLVIVNTETGRVQEVIYDSFAHSLGWLTAED